MNVFEVTDKTGRKIRLTRKQMEHFTRKHPYMAAHMDDIKETVRNPQVITHSLEDNTVRYYWRYYKHRPSPYKFLLVVVRYLNGEGFILTSLFDKKIT